METEDNNNDNESTFNDEKKDATTQSLAKSASGVLPNGTTSSYDTSIASGVENRDNSPIRKRKIASDSWKSIERIKNENFSASDKEGITRACVKVAQWQNTLKSREKTCLQLQEIRSMLKSERLTLSVCQNLPRISVENKMIAGRRHNEI